MKAFLIFGATIWFLFSSLAPSWGATLATWMLIIGAFGMLGPSFTKLNRQSRRNGYNEYNEY